MSNSSVLSALFLHRRGADPRHARRSRQTRESRAADDQRQTSRSAATSSQQFFSGIDLSSDALGSSDAWMLYHLDGHHESRSLIDAVAQASTLYRIITGAENYLNSAENVWDEVL